MVPSVAQYGSRYPADNDSQADNPVIVNACRELQALGKFILRPEVMAALIDSSLLCPSVWMYNMRAAGMAIRAKVQKQSVK